MKQQTTTKKKNKKKKKIMNKQYIPDMNENVKNIYYIRYKLNKTQVLNISPTQPACASFWLPLFNFCFKFGE